MHRLFLVQLKSSLFHLKPKLLILQEVRRDSKKQKNKIMIQCSLVKLHNTNTSIISLPAALPDGLIRLALKLQLYAMPMLHTKDIMFSQCQ